MSEWRVASMHGSHDVDAVQVMPKIMIKIMVQNAFEEMCE